MTRLVSVGLILVACQVSWADDEPPPAAARRDPSSFTPQRVETPALKYTLLPPYLDQTEGNAAPLYYRALLSLAEANRLNKDPNLWNDLRGMVSLPLAEFPVDKARQALEPFRTTLASAETAARRSSCDWDLPLAENREQLFYVLLPEVQEMRDIARLLAVKARLEIVEGDYEQALRTIQTAYATARHVSEAPFLICDLIGVAIIAITNEQLFALVHAPDAPNLYWALTALPRPIIDLQASLGLEGNSVYSVFPQLLAAKTKTLTPEQWQAELEAFLKKLETVAPDIGGINGDDLAKLKKRIDLETVMARSVEAKTGLIKLGHPSQAAKDMAAGQAILLYTALVFDHFRDDLFKWLYVPIAQGEEQLRKAHAEIVENSDTVEIVPFASVFLPSLDAAARAVTRQESAIAQLRAFEAVRMYAAEHDGELPETLSDITAVPIPDNPQTGKPFDYHRDGETATLGTMPVKVAR